MESTQDNKIDINSIAQSIELAEKTVDKVTVSNDADIAIAQLKIAEKQIKDALNYIKEVAKDKLVGVNTKTLVGKYMKITVSAPKKVNEFRVDHDADSKFFTQIVTLSPNKDAINAYLEEHGSLPIGVHRNELKRSVSISLNKNAIMESLEKE